MIKKYIKLILIIFILIPADSSGNLFIDPRRWIFSIATNLTSLGKYFRTSSLSQSTLGKIHLTLASLARKYLIGNENIQKRKEKSKEIPADFSNIIFHDPTGNIEIKHGGTTKLNVIGPESDIENLMYSAAGNTFVIGAQPRWTSWFNPFKKTPNPLKYVITVKKNGWFAITHNQIGTLYLNNLQFNTLRLICSRLKSCKGSLSVTNLEVKAKGDTIFDLSGQAQDQKLELSDSVTYKAQSLLSKNIELTARDKSSGELNALSRIKGEKYGKGIFKIHGDTSVIAVSQPDLSTDAGTIKLCSSRAKP